MKRFPFIIGLVLVIGLLLGSPGAARALPVGNYVLDFVTDSASPGAATISYDGLGGAVTGSGIPLASVNVMGHGVSENLSGVTFGFTSGNFTSYSSGTWTFAGGGTLTISQGSTPLYSAALGTLNVYMFGGAARIAAAGLNTTYVNGAFFESFLGFKATADTTTVGDLNQTFTGFPVATGSKGPAIQFTALKTGGLQGPIVPAPTSALLFAPALLALVGIRKKFNK